MQQCKRLELIFIDNTFICTAICLLNPLTKPISECFAAEKATPTVLVAPDNSLTGTLDCTIPRCCERCTKPSSLNLIGHR